MARRTFVKRFLDVSLLAAFTAGPVAVANDLPVCNEAKLARWVKQGNADHYFGRGIELRFGDDGYLVVIRGDEETMPMTVVVTAFEGKRICAVDPSRLSYEFRFTNGLNVDDGGVRPVAPGRFSMPVRRSPTRGLSVTVRHLTLGSKTRSVFDPVIVWTVEQYELNELNNSRQQIQKPGYEPLLEPAPPELQAIGRTIGRAIDALDEERLEEALTLVHEVKSSIAALPGGAKWSPAVESVDRISRRIEARKDGGAGG